MSIRINDRTFFAGGAMPTLLLILGLVFNTGNSCAGRRISTAPHTSQQAVDTFLPPLLEQVEAADEPALRIFLRLKITSYLWSAPSGSLKPDSIAAAALADLQAHEKEVPALYIDLFRRDLLAQLKVHAPELAARLTGGDKVDRRSDLEVAYSMLGQKGGVVPAVSLAKRSIDGGKDPGRVAVFFLRRLEKEDPTQVPKLLDALMTAEEQRPGSISANTLFALKHIYVKEQTPQELQRRYITVLVNRAGMKEEKLASLVDIYLVLADVLPTVEKQEPTLYVTASTRLSELAGRMPRRTLERISIDKRVKQSTDPLAQLMTEANVTNDQSLKEDLLTEAAGLALEKGQIRMAIDLVAKLQPESKEASLWRDQFLEGAVGRAVDTGDVETAKHGTARIQLIGVRSSALQKIALHFQTSNDSVSARGTLSSAFNIIKASDDSTDKALALLDLTSSFVKAGDQRAPEAAREAIRVINNSPAVRRGEASGDGHLNAVESMMKIAYKIVPAFEALGRSDEAKALSMSGEFQSKDFRIAATLGAYTGILASNNGGQGMASK